MNWKFWKRRDKVGQIDLESLMKMRESFMKQRSTRQCPCSEEAGIECVCQTCPLKDTCSIEQECYVVARRTHHACYIKECSKRKELLGEQGDAKKETDKSSAGESILGTAGLIAEGVRGEPVNGGIRQSTVVSADGKPSVRLDSIGES